MSDDQVADALLEVADWWTELEADVLPGTARPWREREQQLDNTGRRVPLAAEPQCPSCGRERLRKPDQVVTDDDGAPTGQVLPGRPYCPAGCDDTTGAALGRPPARIDVVAALADLTTASLALERQVREHLGEPLARDDLREVLQPTRPAEPEETRVQTGLWRKQPGRESVQVGEDRWETAAATPADPRVPAALRWLALHHPRITDAGLRSRVRDEAFRMARALRSAVGAAERVVRLQQPCPVCGHLSLAGFLDRCPANEYRRCPDQGECKAEHGVVFCTANDPTEQPLCECDREQCTCHRGGRHYWNPEDFRRLGLVLEAS